MHSVEAHTVGKEPASNYRVAIGCCWAAAADASAASVPAVAAATASHCDMYSQSCTLGLLQR